MREWLRQWRGNGETLAPTPALHRKVGRMTTKGLSGQYNIEDGPSREVLFDALRLRRTIPEAGSVCLALVNQATGDLVFGVFYVQSIEEESDDGHSWNVVFVPQTNQSHRCKAYFNTQRRTGHLDADAL